MTVTTPNAWYLNYGNGSTTGYFAVTKWATGTVETVGNIVRQNAAPATNSERCFICIVAGTTNATTEPTWSTGKGTKTTDNTVTWMECTGNPALNADLTDVPLSSQNRSGTQSLGNIITNNTQDHYFVCTTAGTTGAGEPTYNTTTGGTTTDSGCTWTCLGAVSSFTTKWGAPHARLGAVNSFVPTGTGIVYVSSIHAETQASANSISLGGSAGSNAPVNVICVSNTGSIPPTSADVTTGASVTTTGSNAITLGVNAEINGVAFSGGSGATTSGITIGNVSADLVRLRNCSLAIPATGAAVVLFQGTVEMYNTTIAFGSNSGQYFGMSNGSVLWRDTPSALSATTWPTNLFSGSLGAGMGSLIVENVDLSAFAGSALLGAPEVLRAMFNHCKLPAITNLMNNGYNQQGDYGGFVDFYNCDSGGATYNSYRYGYLANQLVSITAIAQGGASDGTTSYSWQIRTFSGMQQNTPFECQALSIWNTTTAANRTITFKGAYAGTALPTNAQIWLDTVYFGTASSTQGTRGRSGLANILSTPSSWSSDTTDWSTAAPARQNGHSYNLADNIAVSSSGSVNRLFVCTTAGSSAGSLPGGYATATDGTQVTDGAAVFTAVERFTLSLTLSSPQIQEAGYLVNYIRCAAAAGSIFYIDPNPVLS